MLYKKQNPKTSSNDGFLSPTAPRYFPSASLAEIHSLGAQGKGHVPQNIKSLDYCYECYECIALHGRILWVPNCKWSQQSLFSDTEVNLQVLTMVLGCTVCHQMMLSIDSE